MRIHPKNVHKNSPKKRNSRGQKCPRKFKSVHENSLILSTKVPLLCPREFCHLRRPGRFGNTENFCNFAKVSYFWECFDCQLCFFLDFSSIFFSCCSCSCWLFLQSLFVQFWLVQSIIGQPVLFSSVSVLFQIILSNARLDRSKLDEKGHKVVKSLACRDQLNLAQVWL